MTWKDRGWTWRDQFEFLGSLALIMIALPFIVLYALGSWAYLKVVEGIRSL
jgi:uncharacterized membrane protein